VDIQGGKAQMTATWEPACSSRRPAARFESGLSIVELMVSLAIGLVLLTGMSLVFVNSSQTNRENERASAQIENGRYAIETLSTNTRHAGYYGQFSEWPAVPATLPDPCSVSSTTALYNALPLPVQGYRAASLSAQPVVTGACSGTFLAASNLYRGSDILVIRRVNTALASGTVTPGAAYFQANAGTGEMQFGTSTANLPATNAAGAANAIFKVDGVTGADVRKYEHYIYFVAPCRSGSGTGGVCSTSDDTIPTLKRLELSVSGGAAALTLVPIVDGIDYFKVEYGIDSTPTAADTTTGLVGDGIPDSYTASPALADWPNVVSVRIYIVARNIEASAGFTDTKTYTVGSGLSTTPANDQYKRHQFMTEVRINNMAARREIPR
jgi:type IV pilus assembly protein PilW